MIESMGSHPATDVALDEYKRLLGYPSDAELSERARELIDWVRDWYQREGRPWTQVADSSRVEFGDHGVTIDGVTFSSQRLLRTLKRAESSGAVLAAVSAGPELEQHAQLAWKEGRPDEYFFLEAFGSAVVEHLVTMVGAQLCARLEPQGTAVLPHFSPGYADWDMSEQPGLYGLITARNHMPGPLEVLESGMLRPKKSQLVVFGLTHLQDRVGQYGELNPCQRCSFLNCAFRRAPYTRKAEVASDEQPDQGPLDPAGRYRVNIKALRRWAHERLRLHTEPDGTLRATFRYEGTTCTNMGQLLTFDYQVTLGPRAGGYVIRAQRCAPVDGQSGHERMCAYIENGDQLMQAIENETPLLGRPLNDVLSWESPSGGAGCYCAAQDRLHKWRLVLETLHYALVQQDTNSSRTSATTS